MEQINFSDLQQKLLNILAGLLSTQSSSGKEEEHIISSALGLWKAILNLRNELVDEFFEWTHKDNGSSQIKDAQDFIISGIYSRKSKNIRYEFFDSLQLICEKVTENSVGSPLLLTISILTKNMPGNESQIDTTMCSEYFTLFGSLVKLYQGRVNADPALADQAQFSIPELLQEIYTRLVAHESTENDNSTKPDSLLVGMTILVRELLESFISSASYDEMIGLTLSESNDMLHNFFFENLYYMPGTTKSKNKNKCKTTKSRTEAYKLLNALVKNLKPREMATFLEDYMWRMIQPVPRPKSWMHDPSTAMRNMDHGYAGIKNLGNICYMISMLQ